MTGIRDQKVASMNLTDPRWPIPPQTNPAAMEVTPDDVSEDDEGTLKRKLHRAWQLISGDT